MKLFAALFGRSKPTADAAPPDDLADVRDTVARCDSVAQLMQYLCDRSGYVREAAIARCVALKNADLLPAIADRLNDWVPQVRDAARAAVVTLMPLVPAFDVLAALPKVVRLLDAGRSDHRAWVERFETTLLKQLSVDELVAGARSDDQHISRACVGILRAHALIDTTQLLDLMLATPDDIVLAVQAVNLCADLPPEYQRQRYLTALCSHFGPVRAIALRALLEPKPKPEPEPELKAARTSLAVAMLLDTQASVRAVAAAQLTTTQFDLRGYYRHALQRRVLDARRVRVALLALSELANPDDVELVSMFALAPQASVRLAATRACKKRTGVR